MSFDIVHVVFVDAAVACGGHIRADRLSSVVHATLFILLSCVWLYVRADVAMSLYYYRINTSYSSRGLVVTNLHAT